MLFFLIPSDNNEERWKWLLSKLGTKEMGILFQEAYAILNNKDDAEEVLHESLIKGFTKCYQLRDENKFFFWMVRIVRNEAYTYYKRFSLHTAIARAKLELKKQPYDDSAEYQFIREQEDAKLRKAIDELKSPDKEILHMHIFEDIPFPEISKKLHMNYHTVRSQYQRILKRLKRVLED